MVGFLVRLATRTFSRWFGPSSSKSAKKEPGCWECTVNTPPFYLRISRCGYDFRTASIRTGVELYLLHRERRRGGSAYRYHWQHWFRSIPYEQWRKRYSTEK